MADSRRLLSSDAAYAHQRLFVCRHETFDAAEFEQQPMRQCGPDAWKTLQHVKLAPRSRQQSPTVRCSMRTSKSSHWRARSSRAACRSERIDTKVVTYDAIASACRRRANTFHDIDDVDVDYIGIGHVWREKPKVHGSVKQSTRVAHCLGACASPRDLPSTTNHQRRSVFKTVGVSSMLNVG